MNEFCLFCLCLVSFLDIKKWFFYCFMCCKLSEVLVIEDRSLVENFWFGEDFKVCLLNIYMDCLKKLRKLKGNV